MLVPVTTPGAQGGVIELQFATEQNAQLASQLLDQIYAASSEGRLNIENAPTSPPRDSNLLNVFVLGDADAYGGSNLGNSGSVFAEETPSHSHPCTVSLTLPPLAVVVLKPESKKAQDEEKEA